MGFKDVGLPMAALRRLGEAIRRAGARLYLEVVSLDVGPGVDTLALPPIRYTAAEVATFADLRTLLRQAVADGSPVALAGVATASAEINQRYRPHPRFALAMSVAEARQGAKRRGDFLAGGGEMGALIRSHDWSATPLGPPEAWPQSLKTAVRIMLTSSQPFWIGWGRVLC